MIINKDFLIKRISFEETYDLRHRIMNPEKMIHQMKRPGDENAFHFGAFFIKSNKIIGVASFFNEKLLGYPNGQKTYRIRGMAVEELHQGLGIGKALVLYAIDKLQSDLYWCNSRINAVPFYERLGFKKMSNKINVLGFGERYLMVKRNEYLD